MSKRGFWARCARAAGACGAAAVLVWVFTHLVPYRCPLRWGLGIECPGCGITRAAADLLRLDPLAALRQNPMIFVVCAYAAVFIARYLRGRADWLRADRLWKSFACFALLWWAARLLRFLGGGDPAFLEPDALLPTVCRSLAAAAQAVF